MLKILLVEDEARAAKRIQKLLPQYLEGRDYQLFYEENLGHAQEAMLESRVDLVLLDLNLNGEDGFSLLKEIVSYAFHTIIISAYSEKAIEAFEYGVLDFVPKPVRPERFEKALNRYFSRERSNRNMKFLSLRSGGSIESLALAAIKYIRAAGHYSEICLESGACKLHDKTLEKLIMLLPSQFERIHKSHIVNLDFVKTFHAASGSRYFVKLQNDETLPVGRSRYKQIRDKLQHR